MGTTAKVAKTPTCDTHAIIQHVYNVPATVDGKTHFGSWAFMCDECHGTYGLGLGTGVGQRLVLASK